MLYQLDDIERLILEGPGLHVRFSRGFAADLEDGGIDGETGLELPGYAARPLDPEPWWTLPTVDWIARQLSRDPAPRSGSFAWLLRGRIVGRDAYGEPLLADVEVVGRLADSLLAVAHRVWSARSGAVPGAPGDEQTLLTPA
ncbi:DUF6098 family protein [uncultured Leifsonia sp.]|uniref:DUF6098 family protein n=1 Tax=uncultured Leifsonia sp. TaxID=340359 RepID=UPI0028D39905|nr:DUF6098 family protein [uncultured Leifsonia sp.]